MSKSTEWDAFAKLLAAKKENLPKGPGWLDLEIIAANMGVSKKRAGNIWSKLTKEGKAECHDGRRVGKDGNVNRCVWYRVKK